ncbi:hypothetical protein SAMN02745975_00560 [Geosporobacter subterraneus DSM 17957]|uniref:Uncharacterized protein n=1 Tax=Geosporobacter subterraneus DSM 17957 TaxID=1121919 RepID=A0A1M6DSR4_9FIRM|nr:hypothetical protein [Geosporobacter subterraneus]SHI76241.1 hypothetical protein SAMN02745975_00560 [Geosporobacter subterraneus DSM 17957]
MNEFIEALTNWAQAEQDFQYAEPAYVDIAIHKLKAAELQLSLVIRERKYEEVA